MSKYVIELDEDVKILQSISVTQHGNAYTNTKWVANLEELNSDYINEHYGELQDEAYQKGFEDGKKALSELASNAEYQRGLEDAWDVARKLAVETDDGGVSISDLYKIFGTESMCTIMKNNTVYDAIYKLKAYEDKQEEDDPIKVGDCVYDKEEQPRDDGVVTWAGKDTAYVMWRDGSSGERMKESLCKTGRTLNVEAILEAMRT